MAKAKRHYSARGGTAAIPLLPKESGKRLNVYSFRRSFGMQYVQNVATVSITAVGRFHSFRRSGQNGVILYSFGRSRKTVHLRDI